MNTEAQPLQSEINILGSGTVYDRGVLFGIGLSSLLIVAGIITTGRVVTFFDIGSVFIVFGGTFGATLVNYSMPDLLRAWDAFRSVLLVKDFDPIARIVYFVDLAKAVRRDGTLILEREASSQEDPFLAKALEITADGQNQQEIRRILDNELRTTNEHKRRAIQVFNTLASFAPAMGFIGTLIGLVSLLEALNNPASVGPAMAVALITTLYGALLANLVFLPISGKLRVRAEEETLVKQITIEGALCLSQQENPLIVEQRLQSYLPHASDY